MYTTTPLHRTYFVGALGFATIAALVVALLVCIAPTHAEAHSAGATDPHGCHSDRRVGGYHCHRGDYTGIKFSSKSDMLSKKKAGITAEELRTGGGEALGDLASADADTDEEPKRKWSLLRWGDDDQPDEEPSVHAKNAIVPKGLEQRLRTLKSLHDEGLISDGEYASKKAQILGDL